MQSNHQIQQQNTEEVPTYYVNLDDEPENRWNHIVINYKDKLQEISNSLQNDINQLIGSTKSSIVTGILSFLTNKGIVYQHKELQGIADTVGISLGQLVAIHLMYEACAACTSIAVNSNLQDNCPLIIRTMDWDLQQLKPLTIQVELLKKGEIVAKYTTWAGFIGCLTGVSVGKFAFSVNFRNAGGSYLTSLKKLIQYKWPVGFLGREVLENAKDYNQALSFLKKSELCSPCYFTVCGINSGEAEIITRNPDGDIENLSQKLSQNGNLVQTNIDHGSFDENKNILYSIQRRALAQNLLSKNTTGAYDCDELWKILSQEPIFNDETIYGTIMIPQLGVLITRIPRNIKRKQIFIRLNNDVNQVIQDQVNEIQTLEEEAKTVKICKNCKQGFTIKNNSKQHCAHVGEWHEAYSDCSKLKCAWGLKVNIGKQHWNCCFSVYKNSLQCPKSDLHISE